MTTISAEIYDAITATYDVKDSIISDLQYRYMVARYAKKTDIPKPLFVEIVLTAQEIAKKYGAQLDSSRLIGTVDHVALREHLSQPRSEVIPQSVIDLVTDAYVKGKRDFTVPAESEHIPDFKFVYDKLVNVDLYLDIPVGDKLIKCEFTQAYSFFMVELVPPKVETSIIKYGMVAHQGPGISHLAIAQLIANSFESGKDDLFVSRDNHMYEQIQILYRRAAADGGTFTVYHAGIAYNCSIMMWNSSYKIKITKEEKK
jgi:hypothetical protein